MINGFARQYSQLGNSWPVAMKFELFGRQLVAYNVEEAYQASKACRIGEAMWVLEAETPKEAEDRGHEVDLRTDWDEVKANVMLALLRSKFSNADLRAKLLATGQEELVEKSQHGSTFWGIRGIVGQNMLGKLLMQVRGEIKVGWNFKEVHRDA